MSNYVCVLVCLYFVSTQHKGIDDDSRYCGANYKAKNHIDGKVGRKSHSDSKHSLKSDGQQQHRTPTIPCTENLEQIFFKHHVRERERERGVDVSMLLKHMHKWVHECHTLLTHLQEFHQYGIQWRVLVPHEYLNALSETFPHWFFCKLKDLCHSNSMLKAQTSTILSVKLKFSPLTKLHMSSALSTYTLLYAKDSSWVCPGIHALMLRIWLCDVSN